MNIKSEIHKEIDIDWDLKYLAKHQTEYFSIEDKLQCQKFLKDGIIAPELLKIYVTYELETWGDVSKKPITFTCENWTIKGIYRRNKSEYPVEILSITHEI
jgi:hypothetical protein